MTLHEELARELFHGHQERSIPAWAAQRTEDHEPGRRSRVHHSTKTASRVELVRGDKAIGCIA